MERSLYLENMVGEKAPNWRGGVGRHSAGYTRLYAGKNKARSFEHRIAIESAFGKKIPPGAIPHHVDGNKENNRNDNLILCDSRAYHNLIHRRERALKACGHANWLKCCYCKKYDNPESMYVQIKKGNSISARHTECQNEYMKKYRMVGDDSKRISGTNK